MLDKFSDALKIPKEVLRLSERPLSFLVKPFQTMFKLIMITFHGEKVLKKKNNRYPWHPIMNYGVESRIKNRNAGQRGTCLQKSCRCST